MGSTEYFAEIHTFCCYEQFIVAKIVLKLGLDSLEARIISHNKLYS